MDDKQVVKSNHKRTLKGKLNEKGGYRVTPGQSAYLMRFVIHGALSSNHIVDPRHLTDQLKLYLTPLVTVRGTM